MHDTHYQYVDLTCGHAGQTLGSISDSSRDGGACAIDIYIKVYYEELICT